MQLMPIPRLPYLLFGTTVAALLLALGACGSFRYVPPEAIDPPTVAFAKATKEFAQSTQEKLLAPYRREARRDELIKTLVVAIQSNTVSGPSARDFLCYPRYGYERIAHRVTYISTAGSTLGDRAKDPSDSLSDLFAALSSNYAVSISDDPPPNEYDAWRVQSPNGKHCVEAVANADPFATRDYVGKEFGLASIEAGKTALESIWAVIKPLVTGVLQNIDRERRAAAIRTYFADEGNVKQLRTELAATETFLVNEFTLRQRRTAGTAVVAARSLFNREAPHWKKVAEISASAMCKQQLPKLAVGDPAKAKEAKTDPGVMDCMTQAMNAVSAPLQAALDAADAFDAAVEMQLPEERLSKQVDTLRDIALGKQPPDEQAKALVKAATRYLALFSTTREAFSDANKKKIKDALTALQEALTK